MLHTRDGIAPRSCHWMEYYVLGYVWFSLVNEEGWTWLCEIHCLHQRYRFCHDLLSFSSSLSFPHESDPLWLFMIIKLLLLEVKWLPLIFLVDFIVGIFLVDFRCSCHLDFKHQSSQNQLYCKWGSSINWRCCLPFVDNFLQPPHWVDKSRISNCDWPNWCSFEKCSCILLAQLLWMIQVVLFYT